jgi:Na+/proline symporter
MLTLTDYLIISAYFLVILVVGALTGRKQDKEEFLISGRKLTTLQATTTIFSSRIGAAILLTYTALVYMYGMGALWYFVGSVFGLFVFYFFGLKVKKLADKEKFYTMPDFFFFLKGKTAGYLATITTIIIMFGWVVLNFTAGAKLVSEYTPISYDISVIIVGGIILVYLIAGGFDAVVKTDIVQTFGIFLLFVLMMYLLTTTSTKPGLAFMDLFSIPVMQIISFFILYHCRFYPASYRTGHSCRHSRHRTRHFADCWIQQTVAGWTGRFVCGHYLFLGLFFGRHLYVYCFCFSFTGFPGENGFNKVR